MEKIIIRGPNLVGVEKHDVNCVGGVELSAEQIAELRAHAHDADCFYDQINGAYWFTQSVINQVAEQIPHTSEHNATLQSLVR